MISKQTWKPDTCKCIVEEQFDKNNPMIPTICSSVIKKCDDHLDIPDQELYGVIYSNSDGENKRKNLVYKIMMEDHKLGISKKSKNQDGSETLELKDDLDFIWNFSGKGKNRVLNVSVKRKSKDNKLGSSLLTLAKKNSLMKKFNTNFGKGKVKLT